MKSKQQLLDMLDLALGELEAGREAILVGPEDADYVRTLLGLLQDESEEPMTFEPGEVFIYRNGSRTELGVVKRKNDRLKNTYFCYYSVGDTSACTHVSDMHKISNSYAFLIRRLDVSGRIREGEK